FINRTSIRASVACGLVLRLARLRRIRIQLGGIRHCIVQCAPLFRKRISVLPSNARSADVNSLVPKPAGPTFSTAGPSVSSQVTLRRFSDTDHDTCNSPRAEENAPYLPALVASS